MQGRSRCDHVRIRDQITVGSEDVLPLQEVVVVFAGDAGQGVAVPGGTYAFVFELEMSTGALFTGLDEASIKARYSDGAGNKVGALVSENITLMLVPEPATATLLGLGLLALAASRRRV